MKWRYLGIEVWRERCTCITCGELKMSRSIICQSWFLNFEERKDWSSKFVNILWIWEWNICGNPAEWNAEESVFLCCKAVLWMTANHSCLLKQWAVCFVYLLFAEKSSSWMKRWRSLPSMTSGLTLSTNSACKSGTGRPAFLQFLVHLHLFSPFFFFWWSPCTNTSKIT